MTAEVRRAITEGDLREDLDPIRVSESIIGATFGTRILSQSTPGGTISSAIDPDVGIVVPGHRDRSSLAYYREYLAREALRHVKPRPVALTGDAGAN